MDMKSVSGMNSCRKSRNDTTLKKGLAHIGERIVQMVKINNKDVEFLRENSMIGITGYLTKKENEGGLNDLIQQLVGYLD